MLMTVVTFIVWRSKSRIFVDILCMEQHNPKLKAGTSHLTHRYGTSEGELFKEDPVTFRSCQEIARVLMK